MRKASWLLLAIVLLFAFGLVQLFRWRFEAGDVYPPYSSLRTDPMGTQALFESFQAIPGSCRPQTLHSMPSSSHGD